MKRFLSILTAVLLLALLTVPASAAETPRGCVYDAAEILTDEEYRALEDYAQKITGEQQCAVYFVTVEDYRDYCLLAHGFGDTALTDYGKDYISEEFLDNFGDNDWYGGCMDYLTYTDALLSQAREGNVFDRGSRITGGQLWLWSLLLGAGIAAAVCLIQRAMMRKKVRMQTGALGYLEGGRADITRRSDRYTHTTEIRREIKQETGSGNSGGHSHSGGYSGKSGKF